MPRTTSQLLTLFARYEPTTDPVARAYLPAQQLDKARDVQIYRDDACTQPAARYRFGSTRPTRSSRTVMHNCFRYALTWLPASHLCTAPAGSLQLVSKT